MVQLTDMSHEFNTSTTGPTVRERYAVLTELEPKLISVYVPANAAEQKTAFLDGSIRNPDHVYDKLDAIDHERRAKEIAEQGASVLDAPDLNPKFMGAYRQFVDNYQSKARLMQLAHDYNHTEDTDEKARIGAEYMALNSELYGTPDETTYRSLLQEKLAAIDGKELTGEAAQLREELFAMTGFEDAGEVPERFRPSDETINWMHEVVVDLYGGMLSHIPDDRESFTVEEGRAIFQAIIDEEFGEAAEDWKVDVEPAKSVNVKSTEKRIVIPEDRGDLTRDQVRKLVVHEVGVHMLRAVMGEETDLAPLANGLSDYYDAEEGLGVVCEQALASTFREAGIDHYITAGLAYHDGKDFRDTYEVKWRLAVLEKLKDGQEPDTAAVAKAQNTAYGGTMRSMRGTDELPWFKDLSYYNGAVNMWRHLENIRGDDTKFMFVLLGKQNPASIEHERIVYETSSH